MGTGGNAVDRELYDGVLRRKGESVFVSIRLLEAEQFDGLRQRAGKAHFRNKIKSEDVRHVSSSHPGSKSPGFKGSGRQERGFHRVCRREQIGRRAREFILRKDFTTELAGATIIKSSGEGSGRFVSARNTQFIAFAEAESPRFGTKDRLRGRIRLGTGHIDRHRDGMNFHAVLRVR